MAAMVGGIITKPGVSGVGSVLDRSFEATIIFDGNKAEVTNCSHPITMHLGSKCGICGESLFQKYSRFVGTV